MFLQAKRLLFSSILYLDKNINELGPINIKKAFSIHYQECGIMKIVRKYNIDNIIV